MEHTEKITIQRDVSFELQEEGDGRTLYTRIVPYNKPATVSDPPDFVPYQEAFLEGAFDKQLKAAHRVDVFLNFEHQRGLGGLVGRGTSLTTAPDGLYGQFRVLNGPDGDKALELINDDVLTGMSIEATVLRSTVKDGITWRKDARIVNAALCRPSIAAYGGSAAVLAVRTDDETAGEATEEGETTEILAESEATVETPENEPTQVARSEADERLERLGIAPLPKFVVVRNSWDFDPGRFSDEQYEAACLIDLGGDVPAKMRCSLPILEPTGELNAVALERAAEKVGHVPGASLPQKAEAARKLLRLYRMAEMPAPESIRQLATRG